MKILGYIDKNHKNYDDKRYSYTNFFIEEYMSLLEEIGYDIKVTTDYEMYIGKLLVNIKRMNIEKNGIVHQYYSKYELINGLKFLTYYYNKKKVIDDYIKERDEILKNKESIIEKKKLPNVNTNKPKKDKKKKIDKKSNTEIKWIPNIQYIKNVLRKSGYLITQSGNILIVNGKSDIYFSIKTKEFKNKQYSVKINNDLHLINSIKLYV